MADAADCPEEGLRGGGRPFDKAETGSAFDEGHRLLAGFFFAAKAPWSPVVVEISDVGCGEGTGIVNVDEEDAEDEDEAVDEEEFVLCALLRGMKMRVTSSAFIACKPPCAASPGFH